MPLHRQVVMRVNLTPVATIDIEVDEGIAPLIHVLWRQGYSTTGSCQDQDESGFAWVGFKNRAQALAFHHAVPGSLLIKPTPLDFAQAEPDDPGRHGAVGVGFPSLLIEPLTRQFAS